MQALFCYYTGTGYSKLGELANMSWLRNVNIKILQTQKDSRHWWHIHKTINIKINDRAITLK